MNGCLFIYMGYWRGPILERFWNKVNKLDGDDACWEWTAGLDIRGYGMFNQEHAHRFSYRVHYGDFDKKLYVCHKCDNRKCVRPDHLFLGTQLDNMRDRKAKGKYDLWGTKNPNSKITEKTARKIMAMIDKGIPQSDIARSLKVSRHIVHDIKRGRNWSWLRG